MGDKANETIMLVLMGMTVASTVLTLLSIYTINYVQKLLSNYRKRKQRQQEIRCAAEWVCDHSTGLTNSKEEFQKIADIHASLSKRELALFLSLVHSLSKNND